MFQITTKLCFCADNTFLIWCSGLVSQCCDKTSDGMHRISALAWLIIVVDRFVFFFFLFLFPNCFQNLQTTVTSLISIPDSCKTQMPSSGSQALTSFWASFLVFWLAPLLIAGPAVESSLEPIDARLAHSECASLLLMPLLLGLAQGELCLCF